MKVLGQDKETATHSSILAWRIPCTEEPGSPQVSLKEHGQVKAQRHEENGM